MNFRKEELVEAVLFCYKNAIYRVQEQRAVKQDVVEIYSDLSVSVRQTSALVQAYNESCIQRRSAGIYHELQHDLLFSRKFHDKLHECFEMQRTRQRIGEVVGSGMTCLGAT